jgi:hypothetical protein
LKNMDITSFPQKLAQALLEAQAKASDVEKASLNKHQGYNYASTEDMVGEGKQALLAAGLLLVQAGWAPCGPGEVGSRLAIQYVLSHPASGTAVRWASRTSVVPDKGRPIDKAESTALTYSLGYTIRGLLLLKRVEQGTEVDARDTDPPPPQHNAIVTKHGTFTPFADEATVGQYSARIAAAGDMLALSAVYEEIKVDKNLSGGQAQALAGAASDRLKELKKSAKASKTATA